MATRTATKTKGVKKTMAKTKKIAKTDDAAGTMMSIARVERTLPIGTNILDVKVPPELDRQVPTHIDFMDDLLGGGWTPSSVCLLTGQPGAGKTTLALQLADAIHDVKNTIVVYMGTEEAAVQMRKAVRRLGCKNGFICVDVELIERCASWKNDVRACVMDHLLALRAQHGKLVDHVDEHGDKVKRYVGPQFVFICDSLQSHDDGQYYNGHTNSRTQIRVAEQLGALSKSGEWGYPVTILIGQVTKNGDFAGPQALKHVIDMHLELKIDQGKEATERGTAGKRIMWFSKNRFGCTGAKYILEMTSGGLVEHGLLQDM